MSEKGWTGFWAGYSASLVLTLNPSLTFFLFETLKRTLLPRSKRDNPPAWATFFLAAISKACASTVTYPFSLAKTRAQSGTKPISKEENEVVQEDLHDEKTKKAVKATIFSTVLAIAQTEGVTALYEGLPLEIMKGFFSHGITMLIKQAVQRFVVQAYYVLSIILSRYKKKMNASKLAERTKQQSVEYYDLSIARVSERLEEAKNAVKSKANETAEFVAEYVEENNGEWRSLYDTMDLAKWLDERK